MDSVLNELNEIINIYLNKKENLGKISSDIRNIQSELEQININKNNKIEEYRKNNPTTYLEYGAMIRKDLNLEYNQQYQTLTKELDELKKTYNSETLSLKILSINLKNQLVDEKNSLSLKLKEKEIKKEEIENKISNFKYEYNSQSQIINGDEFRNLYISNVTISKEINEIKDTLKQIEEYLDFSHPISKIEITNKEKSNEVYYDLIEAIEKIEIVKLSNNINNHSNELFKIKDVINSINSLYAKEKNNTFVVGESNEQIDKEKIIKLNELLKKYIIYILLTKNKITYTDLLKCYTKEEIEQIKLQFSSINNLGEEYISKKEVIDILNKIFLKESINEKETQKHKK